MADLTNGLDRDWHPADALFVRGQRWTVVQSFPLGDCHALRIASANSQTRRTILLPFDRPRSIRTPASIEVMRPPRWRRALVRLAMDAHPFGSLTAAAGSRIDILPYQLEPALAMLRYGRNRIMVADEVGLGKTIQAGLMIAELAGEQDVFRALVVTPASLRDQWAGELSERFGVSASVVSSHWLTRASRELPPGINPWSLPGTYICSYEYLRRPEVLRPLEDVGWDLLVLDEAHAATIGSARRAAVHAVALRSTRAMLLTATPHGGDDEQFRALCRIGTSDPAEPLTLYRRSRADVGATTRRRTILLPVHLSDAERRVHRLLEGYTSSICKEARARGDHQARLAAMVLRKRALSGPRSLGISCRRRLELLSGAAVPADREQLALPLDEDESLQDEVALSALSAAGLADAPRERTWLESILEAANAVRHESKVRVLSRLLRRVKEPVIVFTEYRDTLEHIRYALRPSHPDPITLHGGMTASERLEAQREFNRDGSLLLATDAAAEGLNLQRRCRTVVHFELPWSPSRLQQRAGRVDRIGQRQAVHEIMLVAEDTAERFVLAPLARRAARARRITSGHASLVDTLTESHVAAAVMEGQPIESLPVRQHEEVIAAPAEAAPAASLEAARLMDLRRWAPHRHGRGGLRVAASVLRAKSGSPAPGLVAIYWLTLAARDGSVAHRELVAFHHVLRIASRPRTPSQLRSLLTRSVIHEPALHKRRLELVEERVDATSKECAAVAQSLARRERLAARPFLSAARQIVQAGLFDRRAARAAAHRSHAATTLSAEMDRRREMLLSRSRLTPALTLAALLVVVDRNLR